jgi:hypothetical protein
MSIVDVRFRHVSTGLRFTYSGLLLSALSVLCAVTLVVVGRDATLLRIAVGLSLVAQGLSIVGLFLCRDVPEKIRATGPISSAAAMSALSIVLILARAIRWLNAPLFVAQAGYLLSAGGLICFLVFLRRLALFLGEPRQIARSEFVLSNTKTVSVRRTASGSQRAAA